MMRVSVEVSIPGNPKLVTDPHVYKFVELDRFETFKTLKDRLLTDIFKDEHRLEGCIVNDRYVEMGFRFTWEHSIYFERDINAEPIQYAINKFERDLVREERDDLDLYNRVNYVMFTGVINK